MWGIEFQIPIERFNDDLTYIVKDEDPGKDDSLGSGVVKISSLVANGGVNEWFTLMHKNNVTGQVLFETRYVGAAGATKDKSQG